MKKLDLHGMKFGRLTVHKQATSFGRRSAWECVCECGETTTVRTEHLRGNRVNSCGCLKGEITSLLKFSHGQARAGKWSVEFRAWCSAKDRCYNPNNEHFDYYGGRGIRMADEWLFNFQAFLDHVGEKPDAAMSLDRIEVNGNYEPGNVRWATPHEQRMNQRRMKS